MKPKTFFIAGGYSHENRGDQAILLSTLKRIHRLYPGSRFVIWTDRPSGIPPLPENINCEIFECPILRLLTKSGWLRAVYRLLFPFSMLFARGVSISAKNLLRKFGEVDWVVLTGGGYLNSGYNLIEMSFLVEYAYDAGRPVALLGQTIGPFFRRRDRRIAQGIFHKSKWIVIREQASFTDADKFSSKIIQGIDDAFGFADGLPAPGTRSGVSDEALLVISLNKIQKVERCYEEVVSSLNLLARHVAPRRLRVVSIPMERSVYCNDNDEARKFENISHRSFAFERIEGPLSCLELYEWVARADLLLSFRLHPLIFSLMAGVPSIGVYEGAYYCRKMNGIFGLFGLSRYSLPVRRIRRLPDLLVQLLDDSSRWLSSRARVREWSLRQDEIFRRVFSGAESPAA